MSDDYRTTNLALVDFEGSSVRYRVDAQGLPWWVAADVCAILDIKNVSQACDRLDADEQDTICFTDTIGRPHVLLLVNEPGLYKLLFRSNKPEAKRFARWVTHDVLPTLRRTGQYQMSQAHSAAPLRARSQDASYTTDTLPPGLPPIPAQYYCRREITLFQIDVFTCLYEHQEAWYTTREVALLGKTSTRMTRFYCKYFADNGLFCRLNLHPRHLFCWNPTAHSANPTLLRVLLAAKATLPRRLARPDLPEWDREDDPRKW